MKAVTVAVWFIASAACIACVAASILLAYEGKDGWGWFLFVAVLLSPSLGAKEDK